MMSPGDMKEIDQKGLNSLAGKVDMRGLNIYIIILTLILSGCGNRENGGVVSVDQSGTTVSGVIDQGEDVLVTIDRMGPNEFIPVDSVRCDENGVFEFTFQNPEMDFYAVKYSDHGYITVIAYPGDHIKIKGVAGSLHPYSIEGSDDSKLVRELAVRHKDVLDELQLISLETNAIRGAENYSELKLGLNRKFDSITHSFHQYSSEYIRQNTGSPAMLIGLYNQYGPRLPVFMLPDDLDMYRYVDSVLYATHPENEAIMSLHSQLTAMEEQMKLMQRKPKLSIGMKAPDFVMNTHDELLLSLSDLKGKYILLQFWATWSKPSLDENIYLSECFGKHKNHTFTILQVSVDDDKLDWLKVIEEQKLTWHHVSDLKRWESAVVDLYEVERIPANFLIDPKGIIIEKDLFGKEIEQAIEKYLK